ncbi:MAG: 6,7-dimethyl-8-ribityllumazine synthase [Chloroflexi bacterium]|nr:6,7-dimethyl-8-ribityllumazine synthase [Chloroflexota bacterium]
MPKELKPLRTAQGLRFGIVVAHFNDLVTTQLLRGALEGLEAHGVDTEAVEVVWVPGSFEIPTAAMKMAKSGRFDAVICLGAVIRGETTHYDHITSAATSGIARVGVETGVPTIFGLVTTDTLEQALTRAGGKGSNKGFDAAVAAIEMANAMRRIK